MTREEAKELLPIIQAFAEGKTIEFMLTDGDWQVANSPTWRSGLTYRIKPEPKYRPFKNVEECWNEMQKHQPFGWIKSKKGFDCQLINGMFENENITIGQATDWDLDSLMDCYTFVDGTPFGVKEE